MLIRHTPSTLFVLSCVAIAAIWTGIAIPRGLAQTPPQGTDPSGEWQLNSARSDDAEKIMAQRRAQLQKRFENERRKYRRGSAPDDDIYNPPPFAPDRDFAQPLEIPVHVAIAQSAGHLLIKSTAVNGDTSTQQYEAGSKSVTSFGTGLADRSVGWHGKDFVISLRAADGNEAKEERYSLDADGRLTIVTTLSGGDLKKAEIKSVYDRAVFSRELIHN